MNIFKRMFKIGQAEVHSLIDKLEDPIKLTEQGIKDLKVQMDQSLESLAEVKALAIKAKNEMVLYNEKTVEYENKAVTLLKKVQNNELDKVEGERLATEALVKKEENEKLALVKQVEMEKFESNVSTLDKNIRRLKADISSYENELKTMKARINVINTTKNINKQMLQLDATSTISMLERMQEKIANEEALAEAYGNIAKESKSIDDEIDRAIGDEKKSKATESLARLKEKMGMN